MSSSLPTVLAAQGDRIHSHWSKNHCRKSEATSAALCSVAAEHMNPFLFCLRHLGSQVLPITCGEYASSFWEFNGHSAWIFAGVSEC